MRLNSPRMTVIYNACMKASKSLIRDFRMYDKELTNFDILTLFNNNKSYPTLLIDSDYLTIWNKFENTIHDWTNTLQTLTDNNIDFSIHTDSYNLDYILI